METEEEFDFGLDQLFGEAEYRDERLQSNATSSAYMGNLELAADSDIEIDQFITEAENVYTGISRLFAEVGIDMEDTLSPEILGPLPTANGIYESASNVGERSVESDTGPRRPILVDTSVPLRSRIAEVPRMEGITDILERYIATMASATTNIESSSTADANLAFLASLPVVSIDDLAEGSNICPICREAFENTEHFEVPVRLPCSHIFGKSCISKWISNNTCPLCRAVCSGPGSLNALAQNRGVNEPSVAIRSLLRNTPAPTPLDLRNTHSAEEVIIRILETRILELADERRRILDYQTSTGAQDGVTSAQIEVCLRSNAALTGAFRRERDRCLRGNWLR